MPRDKETAKPRGFAFLMYEDQRSTVLAVDNMNGAMVLGRMLKVSSRVDCFGGLRFKKGYSAQGESGKDGVWLGRN